MALKKIKTKIKKHIDFLKNKFLFLELEKTRKLNIKKLKKEGKIKVAFLGYALGASCDIFSNLYKKFANNPKFEVTMVIVPNNYCDESTMLSILHSAKDYLDGLGIEYICGYDEKEKSFIDVIQNINPDIVFMTHHYDWFHPYFKIENFKEKIVYIIPYGYFLDDNMDFHVNAEAYTLAHKAFYESKQMIEICKKASKHFDCNICSDFLGYTKTDDLITKKESIIDCWKIKDKRVKRIVWATHHLDANFSNFLAHKDLILDITKKYQSSIQFAFRPHAGLKGSLKRVVGWSNQEIEDYFKEWENLPNGFVSYGDFKDLFITSDAIILESISFMAEYMLTNKPALFVAKNLENLKLNKFGTQISNYLYKAQTEKDILKFIEEVVLNDKDTLKREREIFVKNCLLSPNNKTGAENIYNYVLNEIFENETEVL